MSPRSSRAEVRNPIAGDPEVAALIAAASPEARALLRAVLRVLSKKWRGVAEHAWRKHKAPVAAYHKANAVNARHLAFALLPPKARAHTVFVDLKLDRKVVRALREVLDVFRDCIGSDSFAEFAGTSAHGRSVRNDKIVRALAVLALAESL